MGKRNDKLLEDVDYEDLTNALKELPITWIPDLIRALVETAYKRNIFREGGASTFITNIEKRTNRAERDSNVTLKRRKPIPAFTRSKKSGVKKIIHEA